MIDREITQRRQYNNTIWRGIGVNMRPSYFSYTARTFIQRQVEYNRTIIEEINFADKIELRRDKA